MRVLGPVVQPPADLPLVDRARCFQSGATGRQAIRHEYFGRAMHARRFPEESQRRFLVTALRHEAFEPFALVIDGAPEGVLHAHRIAERNPFRIAM